MDPASRAKSTVGKAARTIVGESAEAVAGELLELLGQHRVWERLAAGSSGLPAVVSAS